MLKVTVAHDSCEEVLSTLVREKIEFSSPTRCENGITFTVPAVYGGVIKRLGLNAKITPVGFFGVLWRKKRRKGLFIGIILGIFLIYLSTFFVWSVKIEGAGSVPQAEILETLAAHGFHEGVIKRRIDVNEVAISFLADRNEFSFCSINLSGGVAHVELHPRRQKRYAEKDDPYNLVSDADGVIVKLEVENGIAAVEVGEAVHKGQLIVSGIVENTTNTAFRLVRAEGRVWAKVEKNMSFSVPLEYVEKKYVDEKTASVIRVLGHDVGFRRIPRGSSFDVITSIEYPEIFNAELPFGIKRILYAFYVEREVSLTENEALIKAHELYRRRCITELDGATVLSEDFSHTVNDGILTLSCRASVIENICTRQKIEIN